LGVIRTEELLQARRLDGAEQYFARAFDYGFSKTLDEAKGKWNEETLLCDTVRAIRTFRPMVVISRFSGTSADGHGQHQFAGYLSPIAVAAAADPGKCVGSGEPWRALKFYKGQSFSAGSTATLRVNTGRFDPLLGRTYFEVAMEGRSQHRSQGEGRIEFHGDQYSGLNLIESAFPAASGEKSIFDSIDTSIIGIPAVSGHTDEQVMPSLRSLQGLLEKARSTYDPYAPEKLLPLLVESIGAARTAIKMTADTKVKFMLERKEAELVKAVGLAAGLQIDALADREVIVPGETLNSAVKVFAPAGDGLTVKDISIVHGSGWIVTKTDAPKENTPAFNAREAAMTSAFFSVKVPASEHATQPYWLKDARDGDMYRWDIDSNQNRPFQPPVISAKIVINIGDTELSFTQPIQFRFADAARGEIRRDINVVPGITVDVDRRLWVIPVSQREQKRKLTVSISNNSSNPRTGIAGLNINAGNEWKSTADVRTFDLKSRGEKSNVVFDVTIPPGTKAGISEIFPNASIGESLASGSMHVVAYPHIQTHRFYTRTSTKVVLLDLKTAPVKVGYVMGSGDDVPDGIRQMGIDVTLLDEKHLASGDLTQFDSLVVGIRASETRPDFVANNQRLMDYVKNGGNLIVQYQRPSFATQGLLPFPATMGPRVVDENAKVSILQPGHAVFNFPNRITDADFEGWVQERNLYNFDKFDPAYVPLLEAHDSGEAPNNGGLVVAKVGKGTYVYCSYSFFRQLPAGVGGAYRLFANLLSLPRAPKR
jgi:hypothetical protein